MKKIFIIIGMILLVNSVMAQTKFGLKAGTNFNKWSEKIDGNKNEDHQTSLGFHFGLVTDFTITQKFSIQPQLLFVNKGTSENHGDHEDKININSIDIPVNFLYKMPTSSGKFFAGGGPNVGFNLNGTVKSDEEGEDGEKLEFGTGTGEYKVLDFGLNLLAGYELNSGLFFSANYTPGFSNIQNIPAGQDITKRSNYFGISVGYFFGGKTTAKK
jgi:hypothetical protein